MEVVLRKAQLMAVQRPRISICIANYNGEEILPDCLESLHRQDLNHDFEVIIHDDASTDESIKLIRTRYPNVHLLTSDHNLGFCVSNNRMVSQASGEFVLLLNNDAALFPDALSSLLAESRKYPDGAILTLPQFDWKTGDLVDRGSLLDPFYNPIPNLDTERSEVAMAIGACLWIPRHMWNRLGGFPDWFESIAEDLWLCCKARLAGVPVHTLNNSGFRHRQGFSFGGNKPQRSKLSSTYRRRRLSERNKMQTLIVMTPGILMWPLLLSHLVAFVTEGVILLAIKQESRIWRDIYYGCLQDIWGNRAMIRTERQKIQGRRIRSTLSFISQFRAIPRKLILFYYYGIPRITD